MKYYRTFNVVVAVFVIAFPAFLWLIFAKSDGKPELNAAPLAAETASAQAAAPAPAAAAPKKDLLAAMQVEQEPQEPAETESESLADAFDSLPVEDYTASPEGSLLGETIQVTSAPATTPAPAPAAGTGTADDPIVVISGSAGSGTSSGSTSTSSSSNLTATGTAGSGGGGGGSAPAEDTSETPESDPHNEDNNTNTTPNTKPPSGNGGGILPILDQQDLFMFVTLRDQACFKVLEYQELRPLFAPDFVWHVGWFSNETQWARMMRVLRQMNPRIILGYYHSACTTLPAQKDYRQPSKMPNEHVPDAWILKYPNGKPVTYDLEEMDRYMLDMRLEQVRQAMISLAISRAKHYGYDAVSFDNCYWGYGVPAATEAVVSGEQWTEAFMKFYEEAGQEAAKNGLKCVVNVAMRASQIPQGFEAISPYVDGIMTEMPFHKNIVKDGRIDQELAAYEKVLKEGTMVFLYQKDEGRGFETLELARPLVDNYDNIYVSVKDFWAAYFRPGKEQVDGREVPEEVPPVSAWYRNQ